MGVVHRRTDTGPVWHWEGVRVESLGEALNSPVKQVLIGAQDGAPHFVLRYFAVPPGGATGLDHHEHDHGVMVMSGRARVRLGERHEEIGPGDVVYIPGWEWHQFETLGNEPFTFLCIIPPGR